MIKNFLLVGLGGGIGSMLRYASSLLIPSRFFPWSTFAVNITGSFIIGIILALSMRDEVFMNNWKLFLATGICGGFTTFSSFSAEVVALLQRAQYLWAAGTVSLHLFGSLLMTVLGILSVQQFSK